MTRRDTLRTGMAVAVLLRGRRAQAKASQPATPVNFDVPPGACDCHTHIFGDPKKFPLWPGRIYTPGPALPAEMSELHRALHIQRVVIVTPSIYGTDNSSTLFGMKARGANARGVAVIGDQTPERDLETMQRAGIRGIRLNLANAGPPDPALARQRFQSALKRVQPLNWHIQIYTTLAVISSMKDLVHTSPVPVVFDHFGGAKAALGLDQPGFADLVALVKSGKAYVKISGVYHCSSQPDYGDAKPLAQALIAANADRILWGSDWPHPNADAQKGHPLAEVTPLFQIDDGRVLNLLPTWAPDTATRQKILVGNPARLYGF